MDAIELLRADHEQALIMLSQLEDKPGIVGADQMKARKELVTRLVIAESRHEAVEEQFFWPMVRDRLPDGDELAAHAMDQEDAAKRILAALDKADPAQSDFETMVDWIVENLRSHIDYEQTQVWPKILATVDKPALVGLGAEMARAKEKAPTRPHPSTSSRSGVLKTAGMVAAAADKVRDALTGRGRE